MNDVRANDMRDGLGFTLAELLIVVAIIAVLVAIAIPVFNSQLEKSREGTDLANVRSAYAEVMTAAIVEGEPAAGSGVTRNGSAGSYVYTAEVPLQQVQKGWAMSGELVVGGVSTVSDKGTYWINEPDQGAICVIQYKQGDSKPTLNWAGGFYDYKSFMHAAVLTTGSNSNCFNMNYTTNGTIGAIAKALTDETTKNMKTWAAVRDPADAALGKNGYNYIMSEVDINDSSVKVGDKIPAMYVDKNGVYTVGLATVSKAPDRNYKVITVSPVASERGATVSYPCDNGDHTRAEYSENYKSSTLISDGETYASGAAAQTAYKELYEKYKAGK